MTSHNKLVPGLIFERYLMLIFAVSERQLKEYYEIVGESRPLSAIFSKHADFFTEMHF